MARFSVQNIKSGIPGHETRVEKEIHTERNLRELQPVQELLI